MPVTVDSSRAFRKLNRAQRLITLKATKSVFDLADLGKFRAKELAPWGRHRKSGRHLATMIRAIKKVTSEGGSAMVLSANPEGTRFNLPRFLADNEGKYGHWRKTGDWGYMRKTVGYLNRKKKGVAEGNFNRINLR